MGRSLIVSLCFLVVAVVFANAVQIARPHVEIGTKVLLTDSPNDEEFGSQETRQKPPSSSLQVLDQLRGGATASVASPTALKAVATAGFLGAINNFYVSFPYAAAGLTCGVKASAADLVAQKRGGSMVGGKFQIQRNLAYLLYGAVYQGVVQEYVYNHIYPAVFGAGVSPPIVLSKVSCDLLIQSTLITLPVAYFTKALLYRYSLGEAVRRYVTDIKYHGLLKKYFMLWGPVQCLTFSVIPEHLRVSFIAGVSFFWLIILSTISH